MRALELRIPPVAVTLLVGVAMWATSAAFPSLDVPLPPLWRAGLGVLLVAAGTVAPAWLADVQVTGGTRTARIVNQNMDLDMSGDVTLVRDESGLFLRGAMNIDAGRLPVFANTFNVVRGTLDFSREVGLIPRVDLVADTRIRLRSPRTGTSTVERITVHVTGSLAAPEIAYSSESGYPREAVERMLLGLSPYPDEQGDDAALANTSLGAGLNLVERELARGIKFVDTVELEHISGQQPGETQFNPLVGVGKYVRILGGDVYIKGAVGVTNTENLDVLVEYWLRNDLLLQYEMRRRFDEYQGEETHNIDIMYRIEY